MTKHKDLLKQIYSSEHGDAADTLQVCAAQVVGHFLTETFTYPPALLKTRQEVVDFRDLVSVRAFREPLVDPASLAILREIIAYLDRYKPVTLSVTVTATDQLGEVTIINAQPGPPASSRKAKPANPAPEAEGEVVKLADYDHLRKPDSRAA